ncbi:MAG: selenium-dependent molybdenum cofactor biosynthesis protein YqeB [Bilifractor sp.]|jgi:xanthine dehydrogenase accessory factor
MKKDHLIIVRGGGDLATGTIHTLWSAGFPVLSLEAARPAAIRRQVSICEAVYEGVARVEDMEAVRIRDVSETASVWREGKVPLLVDPEGDSIRLLHPDAVVDAILAKRNLGTTRDMAPLTVALGPGFTAGKDVDVVIETMRGHNLGRIIREGSALPNTGIPGNIAGFSEERVMHAPADGVLFGVHQIGDFVEKGTPIARIRTSSGKEVPVNASLSGIIRGLIRDNYPVTEGFKVADIDPRKSEYENCFTISDKARCIAGSVLQVICEKLCQ